MVRLLIGFPITLGLAALAAVVAAFIGAGAAGKSISGAETAVLVLMIGQPSVFVLATLVYGAIIFTAKAPVLAKVLAVVAHLVIGLGTAAVLVMFNFVLFNR